MKILKKLLLRGQHVDITLDTNVLVRIFINDPANANQVEAARFLVKQARSIYIPQVVQAELVWVLNRAYSFTKAEILVILDHLQAHNLFTLQNPLIFMEALSLYKSGKADFADYLIMIEARRARTEIYTFDKGLVQSGGKLCV